MERKQVLALVLLFGAIVAASRLPLAPGQLFSYDDVNFAYAIGDFNPRVSQPQPPGYPLFVLQTRILFWLRFRRPESNLLAIALLGSTAAVVALAWAGNRILGGDTGYCAAWLLVFHHSFWYAGVTSALRVQLALVSAVVAATCWRAWRGERRGIYSSAVALGLAAGIRPALGLLLFPLWAVGAWRAGGWRDRRRGLALLSAVILAWLIPTVIASGGPVDYARSCWEYLADQSALTSGLFGAAAARWQATICWMAVWGFSGVLAWPLAAIFAWRRGGGLGYSWTQVAFLGLWLAPSLVFAVLVHIADAGQALAMVPVVCLVGGYLASRAASRLDPWVPRAHAVVLFLLPSLFLDALIFFRPVWYYQGPAATGWGAAAHRVWADLHTGMSFSSLAQMRGIAWVDDMAFTELRRLAAEKPGNTVVLWERGRTSARKTGYYFQNLPLVVLSPRKIAGDSTPVARFMRGPRVERLLEGGPPLRVPLPAGARLIWMVEPKSDFFRDLRQSFPLTDADLYYNDLPAGGGEQRVGDYLFAW